MADIKQVQLPGSQVVYDIVDAGARALIADLQSYTDYLGVTSTELTDGSTINPIIISGESVTAVVGNIANYGSKEFIFNGTAWQEFGDLSGLGALAFEDTAVASYTPAGTMTDPTVTVSGTASAAAQTITVGGTANAAAQDISLTSSSVTIPNVTAVGSMPTFTVDANGVLTITDGVVPTLGTAIEVNNVTGATASASSVDLTSVTATAQASSVDLTNVTATASGTAFTGTAATITVAPSA